MFLNGTNLATHTETGQPVAFRRSESEGRERTALRGRYNTREEKSGTTQDTKRHQPPETVPFIVYITTLFFYYSPFVLSVHGFLFKSINCY